MKKLLTKILIGILAVTTMLACFAGCSTSASWGGTSMKEWGADLNGGIKGGFIGEKTGYYYYINGVGTSSADNAFGAPVKGALMAVTKDFTKTEIVVPKLFSATDYNAGLYIYGDYVYYGTPNTDKNSTGAVANNELTFMKTKLDGTGTEKLFTLPSLSAEYRIVEKAGVVYIVYYDSVNTALKSFNCNDKTSVEIAKTDEKTEKLESLNAYKFADNTSAVTVYYTVTVYAEDYLEDKEGTRATESYNKVYAYTAGDDVSEQVAILDGSKDASGNLRKNPATYEIKLVKLGVMFYTETINSDASTYALGFAEKITNADVLADTTLFTKEGIYTLTDGVIASTGLYGNYNAQTENVAKAEGASELVARHGDYIYFIDADSGISRVKIANLASGEKQNVEKVSESSVSNAWYDIQFIGDNLFYLDNSSEGASYVKYVNVNQTATPEDTDDDGENDKFYLTGHSELGQKTDEDKVSIATAKVNALSSKLENGVLPFEKDDDGNYKTNTDGKIYVQALVDVESAIEGVTLSDATVTTLNAYKKAVEKANLYFALEGVRSDLVDKTAMQEKYNGVKTQIKEFMNSSDYETISAYIDKNLLWNYQKAVSLFESAE